MQDPFDDLAFEAAERGAAEPSFVVDLGAFEGPLDLLLTLARKQQVDLAGLSISALADQYLAFIEAARRERLELAADYLVMAAWLAYLKSRLLLPKPARPDEPSVEEMAEELALRLERLNAIRLAARALADRPLLGRDVFARGREDAPAENAQPASWTATLYDLLSAYSAVRQKRVAETYQPEIRQVLSLSEARDLLERLIKEAADWTVFDRVLDVRRIGAADRRSARASSFAASLELAREGRLDLRQDEPFSPLYLRRRSLLSLVEA